MKTTSESTIRSSYSPALNLNPDLNLDPQLRAEGESKIKITIKSKNRTAAGVLALLLAVCPAGLAAEISLETAPPVVVRTEPVSGATQVDPRTSEIVVQFSKKMQDGSWSWSTWGEENYPETTGKPRYLADGRTCVLPVKLQPGKFYAIWLNSDKFKNFKDAAGQPAVPYLLTFHTSANGGGGGAGGLDAKIAQLAKAGTEVGEVIRVLGEPKQYLWGNETFQKGNLPATYIMQYPGGVHIMVGDGQVRELRSEPPGPGFAFHGRLRLGSSLDEVLQVVGPPTETVVGRKLEFQPGVLYKDIEGKKGDCYYARPEQHFRCFFTDNRVSALYLPFGEEGDSSTAKPSANMTEREVNRLVNGFPEARDLSTPEGACATWQRATAAKDGKAISQLSFVPLDPKEQQEWFEREGKRDPEGLAIYLKAIADSRIVTVQVWREALANVITFLPFPEGKGRAPYSARTFGLVNGEWKNLGEDRLPSLEAAKAGFAAKKERLWERYQQLKQPSGAAITPPAAATTATTAAPLPPLPSAEQLPGQLIFQGRYRHRSRGSDIETPSQLWIKETPGGGLSALAEVPFMGTKELAVSDQAKRFVRFQNRGKSGYELDLEFNDGSVNLSRRGVRQNLDGKELAVPADAWFDPNTRPDSYVVANLLFRGFAVGAGETKEFRVYDWDNSGEGLADYTIQVKHAGKEKVEVPAGTFEANHFVLTQLSSADTWFKKRAGHVTDFWVLDNQVIVRVLRHREPYEVVLLDYAVPSQPLPGTLAQAKPVGADAAAGASPSGGGATATDDSIKLLNDDQRAVLAWTDRQFRSFFDARTFDGWSEDERGALERKLIDALNGPRSTEYYQAINTLAAMRSTKALPRLREIAFERVDRNNRDRWMCIRALGLIGDRESVPELIHLVYHGNVNTHWWAQISLVRITGQNLGKDWNAWGKWWNEQKSQPPYKPEIVRWWDGQPEPDKLAQALEESDQKFLVTLNPK